MTLAWGLFLVAGLGSNGTVDLRQYELGLALYLGESAESVTFSPDGNFVLFTNSAGEVPYSARLGEVGGRAPERRLVNCLYRVSCADGKLELVAGFKEGQELRGFSILGTGGDVLYRLGTPGSPTERMVWAPVGGKPVALLEPDPGLRAEVCSAPDRRGGMVAYSRRESDRPAPVRVLILDGTGMRELPGIRDWRFALFLGTSTETGEAVFFATSEPTGDGKQGWFAIDWTTGAIRPTIREAPSVYEAVKVKPELVHTHQETTGEITTSDGTVQKVVTRAATRILATDPRGYRVVYQTAEGAFLREWVRKKA